MNLSRFFAIGVTCTVLTSSSAFSTRLDSPFTAVFEAGIRYDDNILHYSKQDIDDFVNNRRTYRYAIETYDDLVTRLSLTLYWRGNTLKEQTRLRIKYAQQLYAINNIKDYQTISLHLRQNWGKSQVQVGYFYIPRFYIRHLPDPDIHQDSRTQYEPCDFEKHQFSLKLSRNIFFRTTAELWYRYGMYDYNPNFNEYDMDTHTFEFSLGKRIDFLRVTADYSYRMARAMGYDEQGESKTTSDDTDISYNQHGLGGELRVDIGTFTTARFACSYYNRYYVTEKSLTEDPYHYDRKDWYLEFSPNIGFELSPNLRIELQYTYKKRDAHSPVKPEIEEVKDYTNNLFGIKLIGKTQL